MSYIERQIEQWRAGLAGSEAFANGDIHELESHLREEIDHLKSLSLSDDEALLVARHRLGDAACLEQEFAKVNPHRLLASRLCWIVAGILSWVVADRVSEATTTVFLWLGCLHDLRTVSLTAIGIVLHLTTMAALVSVDLWWCTRYVVSAVGAGQSMSKARMALLAASPLVIVLALFWSNAMQPLWALRKTDPGRFAYAAMAYAKLELAFTILMPILLVGLIFFLLRRAKRRIQAC
jgi:cbb3-type cytochrome oxidase subunit 3